MPSIALPNRDVAASPVRASTAPSGYMLLGLGLATWMEFYTYDGVNLVLPDIAGTMGLSQDQASWILTTYLSALLFGVPLSIWLAGYVGHLRYIIGCVSLFAVASIGCAVAPDFGTLLVWRAIQGFAGAGLTMWWRASVYMLMPLPQRSAALMRISVMLYLATAVGLVFCGYVTDTFGWRLMFLPNVAFAALAIRLLVKHFPDVPRPADRPASGPVSGPASGIDKPGILLLGIALVALQMVLSRGNIDDWFGSMRIQALTWVGSIALILFVAWQTSPRNPAPLLQLGLLRNRNVQAAVALGLFAGVILSGSIYALPEYLRNVFPHQLSATQAGRIMCVYALTAAFIRPLVTQVIPVFGQRKVLIFAFTILTAAMVLVARLMTTGTPAGYYVIPLVMYAFCLAPMLSAIASGTLSKVPFAQQLDAAAIYLTFRQFGASLGVTLITTLLDWRETLHSSRLFETLPAGASQALSSQAGAWMNQAAQFAVGRGGFSPFQSQQMALQMLSNEAARQAATLAYADAFLFMAAIGVIAIFAVAFMTAAPGTKPQIAKPEGTKQ
jgi:MFS transporter, DHA2 family, multidrug resistance protein